MVTRTFRRPRANEPVDAQRLTSSLAPSVVLTHEVRWHVGLPYGHPHLSSTKGKWARWHAETNIVSCTFCRPDPWSQVTCGVPLCLPAPFVNQGQTSPLTRRVTSSSAPFVIQGQRVRWQAEIPFGHLRLLSTEGNEFDGIRMMLVVRCWSFSKFLQVFTLVVRKHSGPTTREILLYWPGTIECNSEGKCRGCPTLSFSRHWSLLTLLMPFLFFLNDKFRWRGYWPAEWCSARMKLVSYLYFAFISIKR